jgi:hypothetical protein
LSRVCRVLQDSDLSASPFRGPHVHRIDRAPRPVQVSGRAQFVVSGRAQFVQGQAVGLGLHPGLAPLGEPPVGRRPGRSEWRRQLRPRAPRRGHEDDRRQNLAVPVTSPTAALWPHRGRRHHPLEQLPRLIRRKTLHDRHERRLPNQPNEMCSWAPECVRCAATAVGGRHRSAPTAPGPAPLSRGLRVCAGACPIVRWKRRARRIGKPGVRPSASCVIGAAWIADTRVHENLRLPNLQLPQGESFSACVIVKSCF